MRQTSHGRCPEASTLGQSFSFLCMILRWSDGEKLISRNVPKPEFCLPINRKGRLVQRLAAGLLDRLEPASSIVVQLSPAYLKKTLDKRFPWAYCSRKTICQVRMRKINTTNFSIATRTTARDINRRIALNIIRERQPISRADLARHMKMTRGVVSVLVQELILQGLIYEAAPAEPPREPMPPLLPLNI